MLTVLFGLSGAFVYGAADFLGGIASKRISALKVTALGGASGLLLLLVALPLLGGRWSSDAVTLGAISGITGAVAIALLYRCLAIGPMSILSPVTAVVSAIVPLTAGLARGERLQPIGYLAIGLALIAVVLVGFVPNKKALRPSPAALLMAVAAGALIGVFLIVIDLTPENSGLVPLVANRATNAVILFATIGVLALVARARERASASASARSRSRSRSSASIPASSADERMQRPHVRNVVDRRTGAGARARPAPVPRSGPDEAAPMHSRDTAAAAMHSPDTAAVSVPDRGVWRPGLTLAAIGGLTDASANVLLLLGLRVGDLSIVSVLTAMYPAGTIILAAIVLKERITPTQLIGLILAITAAGLLALA